MALVPGFTHKAVFDWATADLAPGCIVTSDGLGCFPGVTDAGCQHRAIVADSRKPKELPEFNWINTVLGNLKTSLGGAYHAFDFAKYGPATSARLFTVSTGASEALPLRLFVAAATIGPRPARWLRQAEESF